jgi:hypothetical protein
MRVPALLALVLTACGAAARPPVATPAEQALAARLDELAYQGGLRASAAGVTLIRLDSGTVRIVRTAGERGAIASAGRSRIFVGGPFAREIPSSRGDLRIEAEVRGAASTDPLLAGMDLDVDVDGGVVRLMGDLTTAEQAARAVDIALDTPGVVAVESRCAWLPRSR